MNNITLRTISPREIMSDSPALPLVVEEPGRGHLEIFPMEASEPVLFALLQDLFTNHWHEIEFGPSFPGSTWEIKAPNAPTEITLKHGELTVDFGVWHFHLWLGQPPENPQRLVDAAFAQQQQTTRAELYRRINAAGTPSAWLLRLFNGRGETQFGAFLPSPFFSDDFSKRLDPPNWERLALWDKLRKTYLGLAPDPRDRSGKGF